MTRRSAEQRRRMMAAIRSTDTRPEMLIRRFVHRLGYRYRLHVRELPGKPDIVLPRLRKIIDVRGCLWHLHECSNCRVPTSRPDYWQEKLRRNKARDQRNVRKWRRLGWNVLTVWECELTAPSRTFARIEAYLKR